MRYEMYLKAWLALGTMWLMSGGNNSLANTNIDKENGRNSVIVGPVSEFVAEETNK